MILFHMNYMRFVSSLIVASSLLSGCDNSPTKAERKADLEKKRAAYVPPPQLTDVCQAIRETPKSERRTFWLGLKPRSEEQNFDYKLSMPISYFNNLRADIPGEKIDNAHGSTLFFARYPDFAPYNKKFKKDFLYYGDWDRTKPNREFIGLELSVLLGGWTFGSGDVARWLKSERIKFYFERKDSSPEGWQIEERPSEITPDLLELDPDNQYDRSVTYKKYRMFIHRDASGTATDQIFCYKESFGFGHCKHRFVYKDLSILIDYESAYLKDWEQIKHNTMTFFDCATLEKRVRLPLED